MRCFRVRISAHCSITDAVSIGMLCSLPLEFHDFEHVVGLQVAFAAEPVFHRCLQPVEWNTVARLKHSIGYRQRVIEDGVIGEVAHGEVVDPADRTNMALTRSINAHYRESPHEHASNLSRHPWQ